MSNSNSLDFNKPELNSSLSRYDKYVLSPEQIKEREELMDTNNLIKRIKIKGVIINTIGELKKYAKSTKIIIKMENFLDEGDFYYIFNWKLLQELY